MKQDQEKTLMFVISKSLAENEAESFARTLSKNDVWYMAKVWDNPNERRIAKRERFVVCRPLRDKEIVDDAYGQYFNSGELRRVS